MSLAMDSRNINWSILNKRYINRGWLLSFILSILGLNTEGLLLDQYIGCFDYNNETARITTRSNSYSVDHQLTIEKCIATCRQQPHAPAYAALWNGTICHCVDDFGIQQSDDVCKIMCDGNHLEYCGGATIGNNKSSIHCSVYAVCPVGKYRFACDEVCHCKRQIPCHRVTGKCPDGCDGNYTGLSCNILCPVGNYGKGCTEKCNCLNNTRCVYRNGSCPLTLCKAGWTGTSCNIRDCASYNGDCHQNEACLTVDLQFSQLSVCRCSNGFHRRKIWESCIDKDECSEMPSVCGQNALNCTNTIGGFRCSCSLGLTMFNTACLTETGYAQKTVIMGAIVGSVFCLSVVMAISLLVYKYRFGESVIRGTTCTEESNYEVLSRRSDDTNVYQQIAMTRPQM